MSLAALDKDSETMLSNETRAPGGCLRFIGDEKLHSYSFMRMEKKHYKDPIKQAVS